MIYVWSGFYMINTDAGKYRTGSREGYLVEVNKLAQGPPPQRQSQKRRKSNLSVLVRSK